MINMFSGKKVLYHLDHVERTFANQRMFPVHICVDTTNFCTHKCIWCSGYEGQQKRANDVDLDILMPALTAAAKHGLKAVTHLGSGDPVLHRRFLEMTRKIHELGLDQGMLTHGHFPSEWCDQIIENFTWVRFSLDAGSTETHNFVHGVDNHYPHILENIACLAERRNSHNHFTAGVQFVLHQTNLHDMRNAAARVKDLGADYFSIKPVIKRGAVEIRGDKYDIDWSNAEREIEEVLKLAGDDFEVLYKPYQFQINNVPYSKEAPSDPNFRRNYTKCYAINFEWWIRNNLDVAICGPMHKTVGNLLDQDFESILDSERYDAVVDDIDIESCYRGCRPHYLNEAMHELQDATILAEALDSLGEPEFGIHKNFVG